MFCQPTPFVIKQISLSDAMLLIQARDALCMYKTVFGILCFEIQAWLH